MKFSDPRDAIRAQLDGLDTDEQDRTLLRLGIGMFTMTLAVFAAYSSFYLKRAARQTARLAQTLAVLVFVFAVYSAMSSIITHSVKRVSTRLVAALVNRGDLSERAGNAIGVATAGVLLYAAYRVMRWSVEPIIDKVHVPDTDQKNIYEFVKERHGSTADGCDDTMEVQTEFENDA